MNGINNIQAEGQLYDILAPEVVNDYVEKLGKPCANPNGYTTGSLILATDGGNVQRLYKVTQPITSSQNIVEDGNVVRKKLGDLFDDLEVELNGEIDDVDTELGNVKNALSNEVTTRTKVSTHNLLRTRDDNDTWRGVTFTKNSDKTFTLSGQITTSPSIWECANITGAELELLKGAPLIISGSISNTSRMTIAAKDASGTYVLDENVYTDEKTITIPNSAVELSVYFVVNETAGTTVSGTYKPMLRWATDSNSEYSPYVPTNSQLLSYKDNGVLGAKNFYDNNVDYTPSNSTLTKTSTGVRIQSTSDGTYRRAKFNIDLAVGKTYIFSFNVAITSGVGGIVIKDRVTNIDLLSKSIYENSNVEYSVTPVNSSLEITLYCTKATSGAGDVTYSNIMLRLSTDTDPTYQPYAMTNKELTDRAFKYTQVYHQSYTSVTENTYEQAASFSIDRPCIVKALASYTNSTPLGIAICTSTSIASATARYEKESITAEDSKLSVITMLPAGTYYIFVKYNAANKSNYITVDKLDLI